MKRPWIAAAFALFLLSACGDQRVSQEASSSVAKSEVYVPAQTHRTAHFLIHHSAEAEHAVRAGQAMEALYGEYSSVFAVESRGQPYQLLLYASRAEFKQHNRSSPWAEAYYRRPYAVAYPDDGNSPYHWMLHEVTHQLLTEAAGYTPPRWLNEGVASYFGASTLSDGELNLGEPNPERYPIWWLQKLGFDASGKPVLEGKRLPSLEQIVEQNGPPVDDRVNGYYLAWWSLTHYLMQGEEGGHRDATIKLLKQGAGPENFRQLVGDYADVEPRWHRHLLALSKAAGDT